MSGGQPEAADWQVPRIIISGLPDSGNQLPFTSIDAIKGLLNGTVHFGSLFTFILKLFNNLNFARLK